jgi:hypothetical protein
MAIGLSTGSHLGAIDDLSERWGSMARVAAGLQQIIREARFLGEEI